MEMCETIHLDVTAWRVRNVLEGIRIGVEICCFSRFSSSLCSPFINTTTKRKWYKTCAKDDERFCVLFRSMNHLLFGIYLVKNFLRP